MIIVVDDQMWGHNNIVVDGITIIWGYITKYDHSLIVGDGIIIIIVGDRECRMKPINSDH